MTKEGRVESPLFLILGSSCGGRVSLILCLRAGLETYLIFLLSLAAHWVGYKS